MRILSTSQIREADIHTIENEPVKSIDLMERAAYSLFEEVMELNLGKHYTIFCGIGNNGGDGLVLARLLNQAGYDVEVYVVEFSENYSADFKTNLKRLQKFPVSCTFLKEDASDFSIEIDSIVVDAIFGSGLSRPVMGFTAEIITLINNLPNVVISIDSPSGLFNEAPVQEENAVIESAITFTFQVPKLSLFIPENEQYARTWEVLEIGLDKEFIRQCETKFEWLLQEEVSACYLPRNEFAHKGTFGHALIIAGSQGKMGAAVLAARACIRGGAGLVTAFIPEIGLDIVQTAVPEVMCVIDSLKSHISYVGVDTDEFSSIGVGPGMGQSPETEHALGALLEKSEHPMVIDADAINMIAENPGFLKNIPKWSILTPHLREFERLAGSSSTHYERLEKLRSFADEHQLVVVLKGRYTAIAVPQDMIYFNSTGNPGMATAGSGDVLTGIITGLLAQGYIPEDAAKMGVFIHGLSGDIASEYVSEEALVASDIIDNLGNAFQYLV